MDVDKQSARAGESDSAASIWQFATALYGDAEVAKACLDAQDGSGFDVNLLLWATWLAGHGVALSDADVDHAETLCKPWRREVVLPLRQLRRRWKREGAAPGEGAYASIKAVELEAERQQLMLLAAIPLPSRVNAHDDPGLLQANLSTLCRQRGRDASELNAFHEAVHARLASVRSQEAP